MSLLQFERVSYQYDSEDYNIIDELSFSVKPGAFHAIIGVSGCGKSTIFRLINGLLTPKAGEIQVGGRTIAGQKNYCGYMPQKDMLFPWRTVGENLALPLEIKGGFSKAERREMVRSALADVGLFGCEEKRPEELSGGMRQRAAFARTMLTGSELLLLDEPFSALDFQTRLAVCDDVAAILRKEQKTAILVTHDLSEAVSMADRVLVLSRRPATICANLKLSFEKPDLTPFARRNEPEFRTYFNQIWRELNQYG